MSALAAVSTLIACRLLGRHRYRNRVSDVFACEVYCARCSRVFGAFDAPHARQLWNEDTAARRRMMGLVEGVTPIS